MVFRSLSLQTVAVFGQRSLVALVLEPQLHTIGRLNICRSLSSLLALSLWASARCERRVMNLWRDYLQHAPEVHDAPFATRLKIAFEGFKTKMLARLTTGASALAVVTSSASSLAGFDGLNIDNLLPAIPIAKDVKIVATQYIALLGVGVGYLNSYLRSISTT